MAELDVIAIERQGPLATVWLDRPEARNSMGPAFWRQLPEAMADVSDDADVRVVVMAARGPHFSVGLDLKALPEMMPRAQGTSADELDRRAAPSMAARAAAARAGIVQMQRSITSVADCPKPVIAAVHGYCIGGGVDLISACDIRLASADAVFSVRETRLAIVADLGSLQRLPRIIGHGHLCELAYTGKDIDARRAREIGLVNDVVADAGAVAAAAKELAGQIAANSPLAVQGTKAVLRAGEGRSVADGLDYVATHNAGFLQSDDLVEAMTAFAAKRPPEFQGR